MKDLRFAAADNIGFYKNNLVVQKEINWSNMNGALIDYEAIISVYDDNLNAKKHFVIPKEFAANKGSYGNGFGIVGDEAHYITNNNRSSKTKALYAAIDLKSLQLKKMSYLKDAAKNIIYDAPILPQNTIWFDQGFLIDRRDWSMLKGVTANASLEMASYD